MSPAMTFECELKGGAYAVKQIHGVTALKIHWSATINKQPHSVFKQMAINTRRQTLLCLLVQKERRTLMMTLE